MRYIIDILTKYTIQGEISNPTPPKTSQADNPAPLIDVGNSSDAYCKHTKYAPVAKNRPTKATTIDSSKDINNINNSLSDIYLKTLYCLYSLIVYCTPFTYLEGR